MIRSLFNFGRAGLVKNGLYIKNPNQNIIGVLQKEASHYCLQKDFSRKSGANPSTKRNKQILDYEDLIGKKSQKDLKAESTTFDFNYYEDAGKKIVEENQKEINKLGTENFHDDDDESLAKSNENSKQKLLTKNRIIDVSGNQNPPKQKFVEKPSKNLEKPSKKHEKPAKKIHKSPFNKEGETLELESKKNVRFVYKEGQENLTEIKMSGETDMIAHKNPENPNKDLAKGTPEEDLPDFNENTRYIEAERVTKYLSRTGIASRRQSEKMIASGLVAVNNKPIEQNQIINPAKDKVSIFSNRIEKFPVKQNTKIWIFYKPMNLICDERDPKGRLSIFDFIRSTNVIKDHFISIGRLDYKSEGIIILTNDGELARSME